MTAASADSTPTHSADTRYQYRSIPVLFDTRHLPDRGSFPYVGPGDMLSRLRAMAPRDDHDMAAMFPEGTDVLTTAGVSYEATMRPEPPSAMQRTGVIRGSKPDDTDRYGATELQETTNLVAGLWGSDEEPYKWQRGVAARPRISAHLLDFDKSSTLLKGGGLYKPATHISDSLDLSTFSQLHQLLTDGIDFAPSQDPLEDLFDYGLERCFSRVNFDADEYRAYVKARDARSIALYPNQKVFRDMSDGQKVQCFALDTDRNGIFKEPSIVRELFRHSFGQDETSWNDIHSSILTTSSHDAIDTEVWVKAIRSSIMRMDHEEKSRLRGYILPWTRGQMEDELVKEVERHVLRSLLVDGTTDHVPAQVKSLLSAAIGEEADNFWKSIAEGVNLRKLKRIKDIRTGSELQVKSALLLSSDNSAFIGPHLTDMSMNGSGTAGATVPLIATLGFWKAVEDS